MLRKPWSIIILSLFFFILPFINLFTAFYFLKTDVSFLIYLKSLYTIPSNYLSLFNLIVPSFVSAFAIFALKKWSYPLFILSMAWILIHSLYGLNSELHINTKIFGILIPTIFYITLVSYFLIPSVKFNYYEPKIRW
jgi:hypothetical protein